MRLLNRTAFQTVKEWADSHQQPREIKSGKSTNHLSSIQILCSIYSRYIWGWWVPQLLGNSFVSLAALPKRVITSNEPRKWHKTGFADHTLGQWQHGILLVRVCVCVRAHAFPSQEILTMAWCSAVNSRLPTDHLSGKLSWELEAPKISNLHAYIFIYVYFS